MDDTVKGFIEHQNIAHYIAQREVETDPVPARHALKTAGRRGGDANQNRNLIRPATSVCRL